MSAPIIDLITIGDELLLGITRNGHLTYLGEELARRGAPPNRNLVIRDEAEEIKRNFNLAWGESDVVITTGGLGPTADDRTREIIAATLGLPLRYSPEVEADIQEKFKVFGRKMGPNNRKQAFYPEGSQLLANTQGTAPGIWLEHEGRLLIMLPGPPRELKPMFEEQVLPWLSQRGLVKDSGSIVEFQTSGIGESALELKLKPVLDPQEDINVAYCAHYGTVSVRLSSLSGNASMESVRELAAQCEAVLGLDFLAYGRTGLVEVALDLLRQNGQTLAVAESCTGGMLGAALTGVAGSSDCFLGGWVTYSNRSKRNLLGVAQGDLVRRGAVSKTVALAMARGAAEKLQADWALSITGIAGPGGGTEKKPVGTVYVGLWGPGHSLARRLSVRGNRGIVRHRSVNRALDMLRRRILKDRVNGS